MVVFDFFKVIIINFSFDQVILLIVLNFFVDEKRGFYSISFKLVIYIEKFDFREVYDGFKMIVVGN